MAKSAADFLNDLAGRELVPGNIVASLRRQVAAAARPVSAASVARLLVEKGHLTAVQAERLLGAPLRPAAPAASSAAATAPAAPSAPAAPRPQPLQPLQPLPETKLMELDELGLAPVDDVPASAPKASQPAAAAIDPLEPLELGLLDLMPLTDAPAPAAPKAPAAKPASVPKQSAAPAKAPAAPAKKQAAAPLEPLPLEPLSLDVLTPLDSPPKPASTTAAGPAARSAPSHSAPLNPLAPASSASALAPPVAPAGARPPAASRTGRWIGLIIGGLAVLLATGALAAWLLVPRGPGAKEFELAQQDYQARQYAAAVEKYTSFLKSHPRHPQAGLARVRLGVARIHAAKGAGDFSAALPVAREVLAEIDQEPELAQVQGELAPLLSEMAQELVKQAAAADADQAPARLAAAHDALALANNGRYVPGNLRAWHELADAEETLEALERKQASASALKKFVAAADKSIAASDVAKLYAERDKLLADYPELAGGAALDEVGARATKSAAAAVQSLTDLQEGTTDERPSPVVASLALAHQPTATAPGPAGTFFARAGASIWALDSANGKVLWRRPVGSAPGSEPVRLPAESAGVLLVDARRHELLCVAERSGSLRWRHSFDSPIAGAPLAAGDNVFVTTLSGRVTSLATTSGDAIAAAALPAEARLPAAMDAAGQRLYQLADRDFLHVLAAGNLKCECAVYLGHRAECIDTPPAVISGRLVVPENRGIDTALLHVIPLDEAGLPIGEVQQAELPGQVVTPPVALQDRLLVLTDRGTVIALQLPGQSDKPLVKIAENRLETTGSWLRYGVAVGNRLCIADDVLRLFDFTPASGNLKAKWSSDLGVFQSPPQVVADVLLGVRQSTDGAGWIASAVKASDGQPLWETPLAMPMIELSARDGQSAQIVSSSGASAAVPLADLAAHKVHELSPLLVDGKRRTIAASISLAGDRRVLVPAGQPRELLLVDVGQPPRSVSIPDPLAGVPAAAAGGLVLPCTSGAIYWLNAEGVLAAGPIQMSMTPGTRLARCYCAAVAENGEQFVVSDGLGSLYHLAVEKSPEPQLKLLATARLSGPPISSIAALGEHVYVVDRGKLLSLALPDLKPASAQQLDTQAVVFGPKRIGDTLLLATNRQELISIGTDGSIRWQVPLDGSLAGSPVESAGTLIAATQEGLLLRLAADSGKELARVDLGEPLFGSPVVAGSNVLVATTDGVLLKVALPNLQEAAP